MFCYLALSESCLKVTLRKQVIYSPILLILVSQIFTDISLFHFILDKTTVPESAPRQQLTLRGSADIYKLILFLSCVLCYQLNLST